jgi:hypothetical protein
LKNPGGQTERLVSDMATVQVSPFDFPFAHAWGYKLDEWAALPELVKADRREDVANAPRLVTA